MEAYCINLERLSVQAHVTAERTTRQQAENLSSDRNGAGNYSNLNQSSKNFNSVLESLGSGLEESEFIVEEFLEAPEKLVDLIKTLLALEFWRTRVLFFSEEDNSNVDNDFEGGRDGVRSNDKGLAIDLAKNGNGLRVAFILHAETTIVSLLNLIFYRGIPHGLLDGGSAGGNASKGNPSGDEALLSLVDYCARQLIFLGSPSDSNPSLQRQKYPLAAAELASHLQTRSRLDEIRETVLDSSYQTAVASVALARYLCEHIEEMGPSILSRMLELHDFLLLFIPLVEEPPWTRRRLITVNTSKGCCERGGDDGQRHDSGGSEKPKTTTKMIWEKLNNQNEWEETPPSSLLHLTKNEGQPWLAIYHLTTSPICRESYGLDEFRKSQLMRLRKYLNEALLDQLPVMGEVARYLDELSILGVPPSGQGSHRPSSSASSSGLLLQRVDVVREEILRGRDSGWNRANEFCEEVARRQWEDVFCKVTDSRDNELKRIAEEVYGGAGISNDSDVDLQSRAVVAEALLQSNKSSLSKDDEWKGHISKPLDKVTLVIQDNQGVSLGAFEFVPKNDDSGQISETPLGPFRRMKLAIRRISGDGDAIFPSAKAVANIHFQGDEQIHTVSGSISLPTTQHRSTPEGYDEVGISLPTDQYPSKEWRQIGDLDGRNVVIQLGFKRMSRGRVPAGCIFVRGYNLSQAFFSQPVL